MKKSFKIKKIIHPETKTNVWLRHTKAGFALFSTKKNKLMIG